MSLFFISSFEYHPIRFLARSPRTTGLPPRRAGLALRTISSSRCIHRLVPTLLTGTVTIILSLSTNRMRRFDSVSVRPGAVPASVSTWTWRSGTFPSPLSFLNLFPWLDFVCVAELFVSDGGADGAGRAPRHRVKLTRIRHSMARILNCLNSPMSRCSNFYNVILPEVSNTVFFSANRIRDADRRALRKILV